MKHFITTYEDNFDFALQTKFNMYQGKGLDPEIIIGEKIDNDKYKRTTVLHWNWIEKVIPKCIESGDDCIVFEDDVRLTGDLNDLKYQENDIIWFGFRRGRLENKNKTITGTQALYFKKEVLLDLYDYFSNYKNKIQIDNLMSKFCVEFSKKYKIQQPKSSYCYEQEHTSLISLDDWSSYTKPK